MAIARTALGITAALLLGTAPVAAAPTLVTGIVVGIGLTADLLALYTAAGGAGPPVNRLTIKTNATETTFGMSLVGGAVLTSGEMQFVGQSQGLFNPPGGPANITSFWEWDLTLSIVDGFFNDLVGIRGTLQHIWAPSGHANDAPKGNPIQFALTVDTGNTLGSPILDTLLPRPKCRAHPQDHGDCIDRAVLSATVDRGTIYDDILSFGLEMEARHVARAIPEPPGLALLAAALLALGLARRVRAGSPCSRPFSLLVSAGKGVQAFAWSCFPSRRLRPAGLKTR